jgi:hypothetical protein
LPRLLWSMIDSCWRTPNHDHIRAGCDVRIQSVLFSISWYFCQQPSISKSICRTKFQL